MTVKELERRLVELERQVQLLSNDVAESKTRPNRHWLASIERFVGDEDLLSIFKEAQKLRETDRRTTRPRKSPRRKSSP